MKRQSTLPAGFNTVDGVRDTLANAGSPVDKLTALWEIGDARAIAALMDQENQTAICIGLNLLLTGTGAMLHLYDGEARKPFGEAYPPEPGTPFEILSFEDFNTRARELGVMYRAVGNSTLESFRVPLPLPGIQCQSCGQPWDITNAHDCIRQEELRRLPISQIPRLQGQTLSDLRRILLLDGTNKPSQNGKKLLLQSPLKGRQLSQIKGGMDYPLTLDDIVNVILVKYWHLTCWSEYQRDIVVGWFRDAGFTVDLAKVSVSRGREFANRGDQVVEVPLRNNVVNVQSLGGATNHNITLCPYHCDTDGVIWINAAQSAADALKLLYAALEGARET